MRRPAIPLLAAAALILASAAPARAATTITVAADGSGNYTTIQAALAKAVPGDTISVKAGTYHGQVALSSGKHDITIKGASGVATDVVITGNTPQSSGGATGSATVLNQAANTTIT